MHEPKGVVVPVFNKGFPTCKHLVTRLRNISPLPAALLEIPKNVLEIILLFTPST
jgi:hypothetical protein